VEEWRSGGVGVEVGKGKKYKYLLFVCSLFVVCLGRRTKTTKLPMKKRNEIKLF